MQFIIMQDFSTLKTYIPLGFGTLGHGFNMVQQLLPQQPLWVAIGVLGRYPGQLNPWVDAWLHSWLP